MCDKIEIIEDEMFVVKWLCNCFIYIYMCNECFEWIEKWIKECIVIGNFKLYELKKIEEDW